MFKKKILVIFPLLPKYDVDFFNLFVSMCNFELYVVADIKNKNDLSLSEYENNSFNIIHSDIKKFGPFEYTTGLKKIILTINPDLIIYSASPRDLGQMFSILNSKMLGNKIAIWSMFHRIGGPRSYSSLYYRFLGFIADRNLTYSKIGKYYQIARGVNANKIDIVGTAIDEKKIFSTIVEKNDITNLQQKYNLVDKFVLLQVLRLTSIKKPYFLIDMMKVLIKKEPNVVLVLIGGGVMEEEIKNYVILHGLKDNVLFLGPIYNNVILNEWFKLSHVFVIPTCIGLSAHHACCYGLPIVTDDSIENQASEFDILQNRLNCLLYNAGSLDSFTEKIIELKNNKELYNRISRNALITVKDIYTLEAKALNLKKSIDTIFQEVG